jgi:hypothetical protein
MSKVVVDHQRAHPERRGRHGCGRQRGKGRKLRPEEIRPEVIADQKRGVPEFLGRSRALQPGLSGRHSFIDHAETKWTHWGRSLCQSYGASDSAALGHVSLRVV